MLAYVYLLSLQVVVSSELTAAMARLNVAQPQQEVEQQLVSHMSTACVCICNLIPWLVLH